MDLILRLPCESAYFLSLSSSSSPTRSRNDLKRSIVGHEQVETLSFFVLLSVKGQALDLLRFCHDVCRAIFGLEEGLFPEVVSLLQRAKFLLLL